MKNVIPLSQLLRPTEAPARMVSTTAAAKPVGVDSRSGSNSACETSGLRRLDPSQLRGSITWGEAEARLLFARAQISQEPTGAVEAQANVCASAAMRLLE